MAVTYRQYTPSEEVLRNLELSRKRAATVRTRAVRCPYCHRLIAVVPVTQTEMIFPKCQRCKFNGPLDPRYFRRMKPYQKHHMRPAGKPAR